MTVFHCLERIPGANLDSAIRVLNDVRWHINQESSKSGKLTVRTGESALISTDDPQIAEAFLLGMALVVADLPGDLLDEYKRRMLSLE